jgi:hypothetical protein
LPPISEFEPAVREISGLSRQLHSSCAIGGVYWGACIGLAFCCSVLYASSPLLRGLSASIGSGPPNPL